VVIGTGLLKPNISVIVGQLYSKEDSRRDAGFSIFYMGINIGAFLAPIACGFLAQSKTFKSLLEGWGLDPVNSWHWGFAAAAVGMFFGLLQYVATSRYLGQAGLHPAPAASPAVAAAQRRTLFVGLGLFAVAALVVALLGATRPELLTKDNINRAFTVLLFTIVVGFFSKLFLAGDWTASERARLITITVLFCGAAIFWGIFEQAGSTLTLFADRSTDNNAFGRPFPSSWWQSANAIFIVILAPVFAWLWTSLGRHNPSYPAKFAVGLVLVGLGFALLVLPSGAAEKGQRVSPLWLLGVYFLHTVGELCLSPVGLSSMTRLAPTRVISLMMGVWFLALSVGNYIGGTVAGLYKSFSLGSLFGTVAASGIVMGLIMFALVIPVRNMMARNAEAGSAP
jgi:POT family proton-dependent oligopeptide transporter